MGAYLGFLGPKAAGRVHQRARPVLPRGSGAGFATGPAFNRPNPPTTRPIRPGAAVPEAAPAGPPEGAKCKKNSKVVETPVVETPVVPPQVVHPRAPVATRIPVVNPEPVIPPRVTRSKTRVKARNDSPPKESSPKECVNVSAPLSDAIGSKDMVVSPSKNGKGLKGVQKDKTIIS
ncbi:hypothetical protein LIER_40435 [Lithospermum erythrorhizon]|uniref:Uncharacterized protein n=1 Tax=Lithospermum erythrorhizon TaxID=34254 RepID=A0AAV3QUN9_LITER